MRAGASGGRRGRARALHSSQARCTRTNASFASFCRAAGCRSGWHSNACARRGRRADGVRQPAGPVSRVGKPDRAHEHAAAVAARGLRASAGGLRAPDAGTRSAPRPVLRREAGPALPSSCRRGRCERTKQLARRSCTQAAGVTVVRGARGLWPLGQRRLVTSSHRTPAGPLRDPRLPPSAHCFRSDASAFTRAVVLRRRRRRRSFSLSQAQRRRRRRLVQSRPPRTMWRCQTLQPSPAARGGHCLVTLPDNNVVLFWGADNEGRCLSDVWLLRSGARAHRDPRVAAAVALRLTTVTLSAARLLVARPPHRRPVRMGAARDGRRCGVAAAAAARGGDGDRGGSPCFRAGWPRPGHRTAVRRRRVAGHRRGAQQAPTGWWRILWRRGCRRRPPARGAWQRAGSGTARSRRVARPRGATRTAHACSRTGASCSSAAPGARSRVPPLHACTHDRPRLSARVPSAHGQPCQVGLTRRRAERTGSPETTCSCSTQARVRSVPGSHSRLPSSPLPYCWRAGRPGGPLQSRCLGRRLR